MILDFLLVVVGFVFLIVGADKLVDGASNIARRVGVSDLVIGLTVVAFGTSLPELVVNLISVTSGSTDLAVTNILGSNSINTFVILGCAALVSPIMAQHVRWNLVMGVVASLLIWGLIGDGNGLTRIDGIILLAFFVYYMLHLARETHEEKLKQMDAEPESMVQLTHAVWVDFVMVVLGLVALVGGGEAIVKGATSIAEQMGVGEAIIGLTIVALGTSLPELATSVIAAYKGNSGLALGNVLGSNIFNIFLILGVSSTIKPLPAYDGIWLDALMVAAGALMTQVFIEVGRDGKCINRLEGALLLLFYGLYLAFRLLTLNTGMDSLLHYI